MISTLVHLFGINRKISGTRSRDVWTGEAHIKRLNGIPHNNMIL